MEASALPASVGLTRARLGLGVPLLRLRSDEQLVSLFRAGNEDAFRVIHDRYRTRMIAYARQMLTASAGDAEDVVQEIFVRAYAGLRANRRDLALRAWLYRIAHNRCIDELRRPHAVAVEAIDELGESTTADPHARAEQREALRRLIADVQRLPEQQRSALLMRELGGMPYADLSGALGVSVPAVKSLLVRARVGLAASSEARDTACAAIREDLIVAHDRGVRASGRARRHLRDCSGCRQFRSEVQGMSHRFALLLPALGPLGVAAKLIGFGGLGLGSGGGAAAGSGTGAAAGSGAAVTATGAAATTTGAAAAGGGVAGGAAATGGAVATTTGAVATSGAVVGSGAAAGGGIAAVAGAGHVVTILAATAVAAGGAIGIQHEVSAPSHPPAQHASAPRAAAGSPGSQATTVASVGENTSQTSTAPATSATSVATTGGQTTTGETATTRTGTSVQGTGSRVFNAPGVRLLGVGTATNGTGTNPTATDPTSTLGTPTDPTATGTTGNPTATGTTPTDPTATGTTGNPTSTSGATTTTVPSGGAPVTGTPTGRVPTAPTTTGGTSSHTGGSTLIPALKSGRSKRIAVRIRGWGDHGHSHGSAHHRSSGRTFSVVR